jgi:alpha-mannosidase II
LRGAPIDVYLVPHTHLDPGWIETIEDYYSKKVRSILNNVIFELWKDRNKKFTWCETSFLKMYWNDKDVPMGMKDKLTSLLWEGKIEIVGGGWV